VPNSSGAEDDDQFREARAYNQSIYMMVGMPYLLLGVFGALVYRGFKYKALAERGANPAADDEPGDQPCPPHSIDGDSSPGP
jgi:hypothetical protein